jgi:hypothetical protein
MGNSKKRQIEGENKSQQRQTHRNKVRKYEKLLNLFPNSIQRSIWEEKLNHSKSRL